MRLSNASFRVARALVAIAAAAAPATSQCPPTSVDGAFVGWSAFAASLPAGGSFTANAVATGGNPGAAYAVTHLVPGGVPGAILIVVHLPPAAIPAPPTGFATVDLAVDVLVASESPAGAFGGVGFFFVAEQAGALFYAPSTATIPLLGAGWTTVTASGLGATDFVNATGGAPAFLDFAPTAAPIRFGFLSENAHLDGSCFTQPGCGPGTTSSVFDDYAVTVYPAAAVTTLAPGCGAPALTLLATPLVVGGPVSVYVAAAAPGGVGSIFISAPPAAPLSIGGGCLVGLDLATAVELAPFALDAAGTWLLTATAPFDCGLFGATLAAQAVLLTPGAPGFALSPALRLTFGG
ncbi:MAG TPA: hypothetical protein VEI02_16420 [Planctomycetota bacterium]|nr:hypothetical protein [Planctomycetota bacterium]